MTFQHVGLENSAKFRKFTFLQGVEYSMDSFMWRNNDGDGDGGQQCVGEVMGRGCSVIRVSIFSSYTRPIRRSTTSLSGRGRTDGPRFGAGQASVIYRTRLPVGRVGRPLGLFIYDEWH